MENNDEDDDDESKFVEQYRANILRCEICSIFGNSNCKFVWVLVDFLLIYGADRKSVV